MLYSDEFLQALQNDPVSGAIELCDILFEELKSTNPNGWQPEDFPALLEAYALATELIDSGMLPIKDGYPAINGSFSVDLCQRLYGFLDHLKDQCAAEQSKLQVASLRNKFRSSLGRAFAYEFSQGDLDRVQSLINQLREQIAVAKNFDKNHQQRLLRRLERLQAELHKRVSDLDRFWGLIGDAGVVLGKLGNDAKPIVDRIREIADIIWQTQSRAEELPSGTKLPQLEHRQDTPGEA